MKKPKWKIKRERELAVHWEFFFLNLATSLLMVVFALIIGSLVYYCITGTKLGDDTEVVINTEEETETELIRFPQDNDYPQNEYDEWVDEITTPIEVSPGIDEYEGYWYIFCVVEEVKKDTFVAQMPWNEYEEFYMMADPPLNDFGEPEFTIVVFKVPKELWTDFSKYEVISVV